MLICTFSFMEKSPSELRQHMEKKKKKDKVEKPESLLKTKPHNFEIKFTK